jgi:hypothetical protein
LDRQRQVGWRLPDNLRKEVEAYASKEGVTSSQAAESLITAGLAARNEGLYAGEVSRMVREMMRGELSLFRDTEERVLGEELYSVSSTFDHILSLMESVLVAVCIDRTGLDQLSLDERVAYLKEAGWLAHCGSPYGDAVKGASTAIRQQEGGGAL